MASTRMFVTYTLVGLAFALLGVLLAALEIGPMPNLALLALWPASTFALLGLLYRFNTDLGVRLLGKDAQTGSLPVLPTLLMLPVYTVHWVIWLVRHTIVLPLKGENPFDLVSDGIYVGRWPLRYPSEFPEECEVVVDLTAEFPARQGVTNSRRYICLPSLDCEMPSSDALLALSAEVAAMRGSAYIHCANGHGRSSCLAALVMMRRGHASSWRDAWSIMKKARPLISIQYAQEVVMDDLESRMRRDGVLEGAALARLPAREAQDGARKHLPEGIELQTNPLPHSVSSRLRKPDAAGGAIGQPLETDDHHVAVETVASLRSGLIEGSHTPDEKVR